MGVTAKRLALAALALGALLLPFRKISPPSKVGEDELEGRYLALTQELRDARARWTALVARDSLLATLPALARAGSGAHVHLGGFPQQTNSEEVANRLASEWKELGPTDSSVSTALYVYDVKQEPSQILWGSYWGNLITEREHGIVCITIVPGERTSDGQLKVGTELLSTATAPCALLLAFGKPGAHVAAWLDTTRYLSARSNAWFLAEGSHEFEGGPWEWFWDIRAYTLRRYRPVLQLPLLGEFLIAEQLAPPYRFGGPGIRCIVGDETACQRSVLHSGLMLAHDPGVPRDLTVGITLLTPDSVTLTTPRPAKASFLSDLIKDKGRARFRTFWKSDLSFEESFRAAFGESLGHWTGRWARARWDESWEAHYGGATIRLGTTLSSSWPLIVITWTALALAAVAWTAQRKQVT